jgi:alpha-tubulin suppressor-like RCC1 family protein
LVSLRTVVELDVWSGFLTAKAPPPAIYKSSFKLTGSMPIGSTVELTGAGGASIGQVIYTDQNSWSCTVGNLAAGDNFFTVTGTDTNGGTQLDTARVNFVPTHTIAAGGFHTATLKGDGTALAWGSNDSGELGNGSTVNSAIPVQVSGLSGLDTIAAGFFHTLALKNDGTVWSWGLNDNGQLGNSTATSSSIPVQVSGLNSATSIGGGGLHSLALMGDGTVQAWGENSSGQLGNGSNANSTTPVTVSSLSGVIAIAGGDQHSMALKSDGTVWTWGDNSNGKLGNGTTTGSSSIPAQVSSLTGVKAISAGTLHSVALKGDGTVWSWGYNGEGELGNNTTTDSTTPVQVNGLSNITSIAAGGFHTIALKNDGTVWTWGSNSKGQL